MFALLWVFRSGYVLGSDTVTLGFHSKCLWSEKKWVWNPLLHIYFLTNKSSSLVSVPFQNTSSLGPGKLGLNISFIRLNSDFLHSKPLRISRVSCERTEAQFHAATLGSRRSLPGVYEPYAKMGFVTSEKKFRINHLKKQCWRFVNYILRLKSGDWGRVRLRRKEDSKRMRLWAYFRPSLPPLFSWWS